MVKSVINPSLEYKETKFVDKRDDGHFSASYDIVFRDIDPNKVTTVTFGRLNKKYKLMGISYFPMYLVIDEIVQGKIGVIEIAFGSQRNIKDKANDIDPQKMPTPLLFNFVNANFINSFQSDMINTDDTDTTNSTEDDDEDKDDDDDDEDDDDDDDEDDDDDDDDDKDDDYGDDYDDDD